MIYSCPDGGFTIHPSKFFDQRVSSRTHLSKTSHELVQLFMELYVQYDGKNTPTLVSVLSHLKK
jgi:hypothetical protein